MTIDYTKPSEQKTPGIEAEELHTAATATPAKPHELEERICTRCYWLGRPRIIESGSWWGYVLPMFFDEKVTLFGCRECNHPNTMVPLESREGQDAMHWRLKEKRFDNRSTKPTEF